MAAATVAVPARERARSGTRALMPQWVARIVPLAALGAIGALQWQDLVRGLSTGRVLAWVAVSVAAAAAVLLVTRPPRVVPARSGGRRTRDDIAQGVVQRRASRRPTPEFVRAFLLTAIVIMALVAGYWLSGADPELLKPRRWDDLASGLAGGLQALGTVRLPYRSADPWPRIVLELLGSQLLILAGLLTFWPRVATGVKPSRVPLATPERGYPFIALAVLIIVIASPVISLGGGRSAGLGLAVATLSICFLWLERLPLRPGLGVAGLLIVGAGRRAARGVGGGSRPAVVRLPLVRGIARARRPGALLLDAELRPDRLAARGQRDHAGGLGRAVVLEGAQPRRLQRHRLAGHPGGAADLAVRRTLRGGPPEGLGGSPRVDRDRPVQHQAHALRRRDRRRDDGRDQGPVAHRPRRPLARDVGRAEPAAPQRLLHGDRPRPAAGHRADVRSEHRRGRAPGGRAGAHDPVQARRVRQPRPRCVLALEPALRRRDALRAVGQ